MRWCQDGASCKQARALAGATDGRNTRNTTRELDVISVWSFYLFGTLILIVGSESLMRLQKAVPIFAMNTCTDAEKGGAFYRESTSTLSSN